jgi:hypothetical protein
VAPPLRRLAREDELDEAAEHSPAADDALAGAEVVPDERALEREVLGVQRERRVDVLGAERRVPGAVDALGVVRGGVGGGGGGAVVVGGHGVLLGRVDLDRRGATVRRRAKSLRVGGTWLSLRVPIGRDGCRAAGSAGTGVVASPVRRST